MIFEPSWWLRGQHLQSILPSFPGRRPFVERRAASMLAVSQEHLLDCGDGVRLQAFHSPASSPNPDKRPTLVVLLHGWEGSAQSLYVLSLAQSLHEQGFDVVRLNLRDHGDTHHLNRDLFHSCRLGEVVGAIKEIQSRFVKDRLVLAGFSLGGNFMLRVAAQAQQANLRIHRALGISPVLDPAVTLDALERGALLYRWYFVRKWSRSLRRKQQAWPGQFDLDELMASQDLRRMTHELVLSHAGYPRVVVPSTLVTALDDPIIPAADLARIAQPPALKIITTETGGHCGFFESFTGPGWIDRLVLTEIDP
jgi:predicted alpha/beta-fold hydrolase